MDDKIKKTLDKVIMLTQQNKEFGTELRKRLGLSSSATSLYVDSTPINNIEKYLGLDYRTDTRDSIVDYSYITIPDVKNLLESDNREMMRCRYGTRYHKIDFMEFCRYAHLQSEMLLNYYYDKRNNSNLTKIKEHLLYFFPNAKGVDDATSLAAIPYFVKLTSFNKEFSELDIYNIFNNLRTIRNELSHRSPEENEFEIQNYKSKLTKLGLPILPSGWLSSKKIKEDPILNNIFETKVKYTPEFKRYYTFLWSASLPYNEVIEKLRELSQTIAENS